MNEKETIKLIGQQVAELQTCTNNTITKQKGVAGQVINAIKKGEKDYTLLSLLKVLDALGYTLQIVKK